MQPLDGMLRNAGEHIAEPGEWFDVPLRVFGDMDEEADNCSGQELPPHASGFCKMRRIDGTEHEFGTTERRAKVLQQLCSGCAWLVLGGKRDQLGVREWLPFEVGDQPVRATGDVADVEADGTKSMRPRPDSLDRESLGVRCEIFARLLERVEDGRNEGMHVWDRTTQPWLGQLFHQINVP